MESLEGLLLVTDVSTTCAEAIFRVKWRWLPHRLLKRQSREKDLSKWCSEICSRDGHKTRAQIPWTRGSQRGRERISRQKNGGRKNRGRKNRQYEISTGKGSSSKNGRPMKIYLFRVPKVYFIFQHFTMFSFSLTQVCYALGPLSLFIIFGGILPFSLPNISNGSRPKWSPKWSVIIRMTQSDDREAGARFVHQECHYRLNWTTETQKRSTGHSSQSWTRLDDKDYSKAQAL